MIILPFGNHKCQLFLTCVMLPLIARSKFLSTSAGRVSSSSTLGPCLSGPKAHTDRAANKSQPYLSWNHSLTSLFGLSRLILPVSMSTARPCTTVDLCKHCLKGESGRLRSEIWSGYLTVSQGQRLEHLYDNTTDEIPGAFVFTCSSTEEQCMFLCLACKRRQVPCKSRTRISVPPKYMQIKEGDYYKAG